MGQSAPCPRRPPSAPLSCTRSWDPGGQDLRELTLPPGIHALGPPKPAQGPAGLLGARPLYCATRCGGGSPGPTTSPSHRAGGARAGPHPRGRLRFTSKDSESGWGDLTPGQMGPSGGHHPLCHRPRKRWRGSSHGPAVASLWLQSDCGKLPSHGKESAPSPARPTSGGDPRSGQRDMPPRRADVASCCWTKGMPGGQIPRNTGHSRPTVYTPTFTPGPWTESWPWGWPVLGIPDSTTAFLPLPGLTSGPGFLFKVTSLEWGCSVSPVLTLTLTLADQAAGWGGSCVLWLLGRTNSPQAPGSRPLANGGPWVGQSGSGWPSGLHLRVWAVLGLGEGAGWAGCLLGHWAQTSHGAHDGQAEVRGRPTRWLQGIPSPVKGAWPTVHPCMTFTRRRVPT